MKASRIVYICISVAYLLTVLGATVYSLTAYQEKLPQVELLHGNSGKVPTACLVEGPDGMLMNTVERREGPWGSRYVVKQIKIYSYQPIGEGVMFVFEAVNSENPIILRSTADFLYDGMEVRIS